MNNQQITRNTPTFLLRGNWHFLDDGDAEQVIPAQPANYVIRRKVDGGRIELVELENDAYYVVEFPFTGGAHVDVERMIVQYEDGFWFSTNDAAYADGPIPVEVAGYRVIRKVDPWAA